MNIKQAGRLSLFAVSWPIFIESGLQMMMRVTDTLMMSKVSDEAVAAVGVANQIMMFSMLLFNMIALGSAVVIAQYLGARRDGEVGQIAGMTLSISFLFGGLVGLLVMVFSGGLLQVFSLAPELWSLSRSYLMIAAAGLVVQAMLISSVAVIQAHGLTRHTMLVSLGMNVLNIIGNYCVIFGPFGLPKWGVPGVATVTVICQCIGLAVNLFMLNRISGALTRDRLLRWRKEHVSKVLRIGIPASLNNLSYSGNQFVTTIFISWLGASMITAKIYTTNIMFIITVLAIALGRGVQIIVGHLIGEGQQELAYRTVIGSYWRSVLITMAGVAVIVLLREPLLGLFSDSPDIIALGSTLLLLSILLEPGRNLNIIFERSLQAVGDARFTAMSSVLIMWCFSVPLTYFLGIHLGFGLIGIWSAFVIDEWVRGLVLMLRWRSRAWENKSLVSTTAKGAESSA